MLSNIQLSPTKLTFDDHNIPDLSPPPSARCHQRSRTAFDVLPPLPRSTSSSPTRSSTFLPFLSSSRSPSPKRVSPCEAADFDISQGSESRNRSKPVGKVEKLSSWFDGASDPVNITLIPSPRKEMPDPFYQAEGSGFIISSSSDALDTLTRRPKKETLMSMPSANSSRFSFFKKSSTTQLKSGSDYLVNLDIRETLFPDGLPEETQSAAFKELQLNAENLLRKFQVAYTENTTALRSTLSAKNVQADELEASQTRNDHLKMQLLDMAERASEQEKTIAALRADLTAKEAQYRAERSIRKVSDSEYDFATPSRYSRSRTSDISTASESGHESDSAASVFSDTDSLHSPGTSVGEPSPTMKHAQLHRPHIHHQSPIKQQEVTHVVMECQKCHGMKPSEAWEVVGIMRLESAALKGRVAELECANENALDLLNSLTLV